MERARGPNWMRGSNRCPSRRAGSASSCWRRSIFWFGRFGSSSSGWRIWWRSRRRLMTLPGIAEILAATIALEIGDIGRFPDAPHLASYAGTTPRVHASGGRVRYGRLRADVNRYLKGAFVEAANSAAVNHRRCPDRHVSQLYDRLRQRKGHHKAIGAVARHLAEAAFHVLRRQEAYRDPVLERGCTGEV